MVRFKRAKKRLRHVNNNMSEAVHPISGTAMRPKVSSIARVRTVSKMNV